ILVRDSPVSHAVGTFSSLLTDVAQRVEEILATQLRLHRYPPRDAALYAQMLVGMVAYTGQGWLGTRKPAKEVVAARVVHLCWRRASPAWSAPPRALCPSPGTGSARCRRRPRCARATAAARAAEPGAPRLAPCPPRQTPPHRATTRSTASSRAGARSAPICTSL